MKFVFTGRRVVPLIITLGVWILTGSLAPARASEAAAALSLRSASCGPSRFCARRPATAPAFVIFNTGTPDGRMAMASRLGNGSLIEIEAADDFIVSGTVRIDQASFTGLLPSGAPLSSIQDVQVQIARVFPFDSVSPPSGRVPTRVNSPSDIDLASRDQSLGAVSFIASILTANFSAANSVINGINPIPNQTTGGEGAVPGEEVQIDVTLIAPIVLPAGHYFFIPKVNLSSGNFLWLSAAGPGPLAGDLQTWIRDAKLAPDWLRVGTDIVGPTAQFNGSFSLTGARLLFVPAIFR